MIFLLGMLWGQEPAEIPIADQKVIQYLVEKSSEEPTKVLGSASDVNIEGEGSSTISSSLQAELAQQTRPTVPATNQQTLPELGVPWWWGVLFAALMLGVLRYFVRTDPQKIGSIKVQSRTFFGQEGSVVAIEVQDAQQNPRVILLGLHSKGAPRFLADLSAPIPFPELEEPESRMISSVVPKTVSVSTESAKPTISYEEDDEDKEALVEQILRMREDKVQREKQTTRSTEPTLDKWTEGFHEVLRK